MKKGRAGTMTHDYKRNASRFSEGERSTLAPASSSESDTLLTLRVAICRSGNPRERNKVACAPLRSR
jgi:hypothetical protein